MPHVEISYSHRTKGGVSRDAGEVVYVSSAEADAIVRDGRGKVVKPSPEEVVKLAGKQVPARGQAAAPKRPAKRDDGKDA